MSVTTVNARRGRFLNAVTEAMCRLDGFDEQWRTFSCPKPEMTAAAFARNRRSCGRTRMPGNELKELREMMAAVGAKPLVLKALADVEADELCLASEKRVLAARTGRKLDLPESATAFRYLLEQKLQSMAKESHELTALLRLLVSDFHVYLVRLCDGGHLLPRARAVLPGAGWHCSSTLAMCQACHNC